MATPRFIKTISRNSALRNFTCLLGSLYIRFIHASGQWRVENQVIPEKLINEGKTFITCFWHGRLLMMSFAWPYNSSFYMLISTHPDGQLIAKTIKRLGFKVLENSGKNKGALAMRSMVSTLDKGNYVGITPDGPRGPRMRAGYGAIALAKLSGTPILPISYSSSKWKIFQSWDRFVLPLPFAKGVFIWGEPIEISKKADKMEIEAARQKLEEQLTQLTKSADKLVGQQTPEPESGETIR
jgi:lysophospholipid acyltransferase (LPLAT)-like uncharacterized protein|tara:strand:+ start:15 stop:734 length:720 start_codon:yes stop_codon:yes gene_type:complete